MIKLESIASVNSTVLGKIINGEGVLVLPGQGKVKVLNTIGARIWSLIDGKRSVSDIANILTIEYEVDSHQAQLDVLRFLEELAEREIITY
jgi:hypothetical protein